MSKPVDIVELTARSENVSALLKALSHQNRLLIACALSEGEKSVSELEAATGAAQPVLSRDLARLRAAGLVSARRQSKNVFYSIADDRLTQLIRALCAVFGESPCDAKSGNEFDFQTDD